MSRRHRLLIIPLVFAIPLAFNGGQYSLSAQDAYSPFCGRVAAVSCDGPSSAITLLFVDANNAVVRAVIPPERRPLFGSSIEARYEEQSVCIAAAGEPTVLSGFISLRDPSQVTVTSTTPPSIVLPADIVRTCDAGVELPAPVREVHAQYTPAAMRARVHGSVVLQGIVGRDGGVHDVRIMHSLEPTLDVAALTAFAQWAFRPGTRNGEAVAVAVTVQMAFTLR